MFSLQETGTGQILQIFWSTLETNVGGVYCNTHQLNAHIHNKIPQTSVKNTQRFVRSSIAGPPLLRARPPIPLAPAPSTLSISPSTASTLMIPKPVQLKKAGGREEPRKISKGDVLSWSCKEEAKLRNLQPFLGGKGANKTEKSDPRETEQSDSRETKG